MPQSNNNNYIINIDSKNINMMNAVERYCGLLLGTIKPERGPQDDGVDDELILLSALYSLGEKLGYDPKTVERHLDIVTDLKLVRRDHRDIIQMQIEEEDLLQGLPWAKDDLYTAQAHVDKLEKGLSAVRKEIQAVMADEARIKGIVALLLETSKRNGPPDASLAAGKFPYMH